jgi:hypothetical protein
MNAGEKLVQASLRDGWTAFRRSAFPLVTHALLLAVLLAWIQRLPRLPALLIAPPVALWGSTVLLRGAATAVEGRPPGLARLWRRDGASCRRLGFASLLVLTLMALATLPGYALVALSIRFAPASDPITALLVALLPLPAAVVLLHALPLGPLLMAAGGAEARAVPLTLWRSWRLVARRRGVVVVLATLQGALLQLTAGLHPLLGIGVGLPLAICLGTATSGRLNREAGY